MDSLNKVHDDAQASVKNGIIDAANSTQGPGAVDGFTGGAALDLTANTDSLKLTSGECSHKGNRKGNRIKG